MTKKLEEFFGLPPSESSTDEEPAIKTKEEIMSESTKILNALTNAEKLDNALSEVTNLGEHDIEMDDIADKAIQSFKDLNDLSSNVPDAHVGRIMEVAATMLKTAMEAKDSKITRKLKMLELQLKKAKLDSNEGNGQNNGNNDSIEFDRNDLLQRITAVNVQVDEDDKDKD